MKLSWGFILSSLYCSAAASKLGHVYVHDSTPGSQSAPSTVSPEAARLILAQRLGVSRFHSITDESDDRLIQQLSAYGGRQRKLFGEEDVVRTKTHVLIWLEDVEDTTAIIKEPSKWQAEFTISDPPQASDNDRLLEDIIQQAESLPKYADPKGETYSAGIYAEAALSSLRKTSIYNDYLVVFRADELDKLPLSELSKQIASLQAKAEEGGDRSFAMTVVLMPPASSRSKRAAQPWGTYDLPSNIEGRREKTEALLSSSPEPSTSPNPNVSDLKDSPLFTEAQDDSPVLGILPSCFDTESACVKRTHNCSSHGECTLLRKGQKGSEGQVRDCWGCACTPTIVRVDQGMETKRKVTYWGGPACQKKDISVPFWLFVGIGVLLASLISGGIGLLYSMGSEELPSVIGAGVSGPQRK